MIGSVFSPYYAWSGRHNPHNFNGLNVGLYGKGAKRWTLTERSNRSLKQAEAKLNIGPSHLEWDGAALCVTIDEWAVPFPRKVRGELRIIPEGVNETAFSLDRAGRHQWCPIAPKCRIEAHFDQPSLRFSGHGYIDSNWGLEPLEAAFSHWDWSRAP
ncbi:MAG: carotenoid 1,2-hydratase, partial [Pseudomonadota bacterium]